MNRKLIALMVAGVMGVSGYALAQQQGDARGAATAAESGAVTKMLSSRSALPPLTEFRYAGFRYADSAAPRHRPYEQGSEKEEYADCVEYEEYEDDLAVGIESVLTLQSLLRFDTQQQARVSAIEASLKAIEALDGLFAENGEAGVSVRLEREIGAVEVMLEEMRNIEREWQLLAGSLTPEQKSRVKQLKIRL